MSLDRDHAPPPEAIKDAVSGTTVFVGPTSSGPTAATMAAAGAAPQVLGSWADFERVHGGCDGLRTHGAAHPNYLAHAARAFFDNGGTRLRILRVIPSSPDPRSEPLLHDYAPALEALQYVDEPSLLAAPGYSALTQGDVIQESLLACVAEKNARSFLILDSPPHADTQRMRAVRARIENTRAAIYYPWVISSDATAGRKGPQLAEICLPPCAFVCGALARNDHAHGIWKTSSHQELKGALGLEQQISHSDEQQLSSIAVNCLRSSAGEGTRILGERTAGADTDWQYVNVRRYGTHLQCSISGSLQWTDSELNDEPLWGKVRRVICDYLYTQWQRGAFVGGRPDEAFFARCDNSTMTPADIEAGRLVCVIGIALSRPGEFIQIRIDRIVAGRPSACTEPSQAR